MSHRSIGQGQFGLSHRSASSTSLDQIDRLIIWDPIAAALEGLYQGTKGQPAWPPPAMFKALLLSMWGAFPQCLGASDADEPRCC